MEQRGTGHASSVNWGSEDLFFQAGGEKQRRQLHQFFHQQLWNHQCCEQLDFLFLSNHYGTNSKHSCAADCEGTPDTARFILLLVPDKAKHCWRFQMDAGTHFTLRVTQSYLHLVWAPSSFPLRKRKQSLQWAAAIQVCLLCWAGRSGFLRFSSVSFCLFELHKWSSIQFKHTSGATTTVIYSQLHYPFICLWPDFFLNGRRKKPLALCANPASRWIHKKRISKTGSITHWRIVLTALTEKNGTLSQVKCWSCQM